MQSSMAFDSPVANPPVPAHVAAPVALPVSTAPAPEVKREAPKPFTYALPGDVGLQMMETKSSSAATAYVTDEPVKRGRTRPPRSQTAVEPMQMVETGNAVPSQPPVQ
jgi:hypothetical protein